MSRRKKTSFILLTVSFLLLLIFLFIFAKGMDPLSNLILSDDEYQNIIINRRKTEDLYAPTLLFNNYSLPYDKSTKTFLYSMVEGNAHRNNPLVTAADLPADAQIGFKSVDFSDAALHQSNKNAFIIYNKNSFEEFYLCLTTLPVLRINSLAEDIENEGLEYSPEMNCQFILFDNRPELNSNQKLVKSDANMHIRGGSSRKYPKKGFKISLIGDSLGGALRPNHLGLLGMRQDDDWILYPAYNDPQKARNIFSSDLWWDLGAGNNKFNMQNGAQSKYIEVFINNRYWGIYALSYRVDSKQLELNETGDVLTNDYHYRSYSYQDLKADMFQNAGSGSVYGNYELYFPKTSLTDWRKWQPLAEFLRLNEMQDEEFIINYPQWVDMDNAINFQIFLIASMAVDNSGKNVDVVARFDNNRYCLLFSPWDMDQTWGQSWTNRTYLFTENVYPPDYAFFPGYNGINRALDLNMPNVVRAFKDRYFELRQGILSDDSLLLRLEKFKQEIYDSGAITRDTQRWPLSATSEDMSEMTLFIIQRMAYIDGYIQSLSEGESL